MLPEILEPDGGTVQLSLQAVTVQDAYRLGLLENAMYRCDVAYEMRLNDDHSMNCVIELVARKATDVPKTED